MAVLGVLLALSLTATERAEHRAYLANGYFFAGDLAAARREGRAARRIEPRARLRCAGLRLRVQVSGERLDVCDPDRARLPERVERAVRRALARGDRHEARRLDPFRFLRERRAIFAGP